MAKFNCFCLQDGRKNKAKGVRKSSKRPNFKEKLKSLQVKLEHPVKSIDNHELNSTSFSVVVPFAMKGNSKCQVKVMSHESPVAGNASDLAYEGEDEHEENPSSNREYTAFDLQAPEATAGEAKLQLRRGKMNFSDSFDPEVSEHFENRTIEDAEKSVNLIQSGHISDPGIGKAEFWASPKLKRSCSNLESRDVLKKITHQLNCSKSRSFEKLEDLAGRENKGMFPKVPGSPSSVMTRYSADRVMLKKHSSSQVLPSRSRKLWWKLFLWSHRNLHKGSRTKSQALTTSPAFNQQGGYTSDTLETNQAMQLGKLESPSSFTRETRNKGCINNQNDRPCWGDFHGRDPTLWPQNQWVAFSTESSSFRRVEEWVKDLDIQSALPADDGNNIDEDIAFPPSPEISRSPARSTIHFTQRQKVNLSEEVLHANSVVQSLNSSSTVAHISGIGLKVIPTISLFSRLRSVNLSSNFIVRITPGSLPKGLHTLDLSRNKISTIEGLRELTRLRVLDLSYNRICRIGHGLSSCTLIKELYLSGNKISDVEGLHRLLKLTLLDLSFNKIATTKSLGQLVANYNSLLALNLLGNPIQSNISDDQLRKTACSLLPKLTYLNKQPIKPQRAQELLIDNVAKAALGNSGSSSRRKAVKRMNQSGSFSSSVHRSSMHAGHKSSSRSKGRSYHQSPLQISSSALPSSTQ